MPAYNIDVMPFRGKNKTLLRDPSGYTGGGVSGGREFVIPDINPDELKLRQRYAESGFKDNLTSPAGAIGRYQVMPITYKEYTERTGKTGDLMDPEFNESLRDWYMDVNLPKYEAVKRGNPSDYVREYRRYAAYNMGPVALNKALTRAYGAGVDIDNTTDWVSYLPKETRDYVNFIVGGQDIKDTAKTGALYDAARKKYGLLKDGGQIHIKESKKGTFTAAAKAHGKSVQAFASQVLANKDNYSPAMVKKANFARNASKWHSDGGPIGEAINNGKLDILRAAINSVKNKKLL